MLFWFDGMNLEHLYFLFLKIGVFLEHWMKGTGLVEECMDHILKKNHL
jgi:hypothetical protein